jgi:hypothetical protein
LDELKEQKLAGVELPKLMIVLDSLGQMASNKEKEDLLKGNIKQDMTKAKALTSMFRSINTDLGYLDIPLVCTNHTYKCFTKDTQVSMADNTYKHINDVNIGEFVKTLDGDKIVENVVDFEGSTIMEIILDDGEIMKCTKNHKFLINENWDENENAECWISAEDLSPNDTIYAILD